MKKHKKRSSQKNFVQTMIIAGVVGLAIMIIAVVYMVKLFGGKNPGAQVVPDFLSPTTEDISKENIVSSSITGVVYEISSRNIKIWDIENNNYTEMRTKRSTEIKDTYGKPISKKEIQLGAIVDLVYEKKNEDVLYIQESPEAWEETAVGTIDIDTDNKRIKMGNMQYYYAEETLILDRTLKPIEISEINSFDTLRVKGVKDQIWSIQIIEPAGYLKLSNIPETEGVLEVGNNKIYQLREIEDNIPLTAGEHKIVIHMDGYQPFVEHVNIVKEEVYVLDLAKAKEMVTNLSVKVANPQVDYKVLINNKTYKRGETIEIKPGEYTLKVVADGFETTVMEVDLKEGNQRISVTLIKEKPEEETEKDKEESKPSEKPDKKPTKKPSEEKPSQDDKPEVDEIKTVQIIIETDPQDAQVFVGGVYKGTTPALTGLKPGEYEITIEKEGYSTLYSTIIIDASNAQKGFLYTLQKEE